MERLFILAVSLLAALLLAVIAPSVHAQNVPLQGGPWTPGHMPMYSVSGQSQPVVQDSGPAGGGAVGLGLSEFLQVNRPGNGVTTAPYANSGNGPLATHNCFYDAPTTNATGYHYLCLDANAQGGGLLTYGAGGTAAALPLQIISNGLPWLPSSGGLGLPHVANLTALKSLAGGAFATINRDGYMTAGDGGAAVYNWSASACSLNSGAGDNGYQVQPSSGSGCWISAFPATGADVRVWGAVADGVTDAGSAINAALTDYPGPVVIPATSSGFYINTTVVNKGTLLGVAFQPLNNMGSSNAYPGQSWFKCSKTVNPCVQEGALGSLTNAAQLENLVIAGVSGAPNSGVVGLQFAGSYNANTRNVFVVNFDTCVKWGPDNSVAGISSWNFGLHVGACQSHYFTNDGWPEVRVIGGRAGLNGSGDYTATNDFVYFTLTTAVGGGGGPNTILFDDYHFNPGNGGVGCAVNWGGWTGSGGLQLEYRFTNVHFEWHNYTGAGTQGLFCSDSTVPLIQQLYVSHMESSTGGTSTPAFSLNSATALKQWFFDNNVFGCTSLTLAPSPASGAAFNSVHFTNNNGCNGSTFTSNSSGNDTLFLNGNQWASLSIGGSWAGLNIYGDYFANNLTDTATGSVSWGAFPPAAGSWTPTLAFSSGSVTYSLQSGRWYRTPTGGLHARFAITLSGASSPSGNVTVTGFPKNCTTSGASAALQTGSGFSSVTGPVFMNFVGGNAATINLQQANAGAWSQLTGANLTSSTTLAGDLECILAQ